MPETATETQTWPDLAIGLYDRLTGRNAEITYEFENLRIDIPSAASKDASHAPWQIDGTVRVRTKDGK